MSRSSRDIVKKREENENLHFRLLHMAWDCSINVAMARRGWEKKLIIPFAIICCSATVAPATNRDKQWQFMFSSIALNSIEYNYMCRVWHVSVAQHFQKILRHSIADFLEISNDQMDFHIMLVYEQALTFTNGHWCDVQINQLRRAEKWSGLFIPKSRFSKRWRRIWFS